MNDNELDDLLNKWKAPAAKPSLRAKVQAGSTATPQPAKWRFAWPSWHTGKGLLGGLAAGAALFLLVVGAAFPESVGIGKPSPALHAPYLVTSREVSYQSDGSRGAETIVRSYSYKGREIVLDEKTENEPMHDLFMNFHIGMRLLFLRVLPGVTMPESAEWDRKFNEYVQSGCVEKSTLVLGRETILGHSVIRTQDAGPGWRWTAWRAPDLGCFDLRTRSEEPTQNGGFRITREREALMVAMRNGNR